MAWPTDRILVHDRSLAFLFELSPDEVTKRERTEELNGTHELELVTSRVLHEGYRLLTVDNTGKWREHVVYKPDEGHERGKHATGTYVCMWSLQYDLTGTVEGNVAQPGMGSACSSKNAVTAAIGGQSIWTAGECDVPSVAAGKGVVMVGNNAWNRLKQVVAAWGGEVDAEITVSSTGVVTRKVVLRAHLGSTKATRRFDWGEDLTKIHRMADPGPYYCRIVPFGRGQREYAEDDETEFDWPADVTEEPYSEGDGWVHDNGSAYVRDPEAEAVFRTSDGHGGWHYPTKEVKYDEDDPELLLNEATADIHNYTRPGVSYEADVLQFAEAGMDAQGVALGDDIQCVDYGFNPDAALRVQGRVTRMVVNELAPKTDTKLTIGNLGTTLAVTLKDLIGSSTQGLSSRLNHIEGDVNAITSGGTIAYVESLLDAINAQIAADGGYTYLVNGQGNITYDKAVANPFVGTEATQVTQMKGGSLRFANSKKPAFQDIDDWDWKTVITPEGFLGLAAIIARITAGFIGSSDNVVFIDLDNRRMQIGDAATLGGRTVQQLLSDVDSAGVDSIEYGTSASSSTEPTTWSTTAPTSVAKGSWLWIRTTYKDGGTSTTKAYAGTDGQNGADGTDGVGIASTVIEYGTSADAATQPSTWSTTPPTSLPQATWLWVRTTYTYSDQSTKSVYTKSYVGTDGEDGASVYVASSTKSGDTTTVVLSDGTTLTIVDGEDGTNGTNGLNGYVHTAWANSADGSADFSTTVSANKLYLGVYTDHAQADSQSPSAYSWSLIKGADGQDGVDGQDGADGADGADGIGIASITPQYYLSTSSTTATGGSWSSNPPTWSANHYIWTRSLITWDTTPSTTTTTTEVYDAALTQANQRAAQAIADAAEAAKVATNYLTFEQTNGLDVGYSGTSAKTRINGSGMEVFDGNGVSALYAGLSGSNSIVRVGRQSGSGNVVMSSEGYVDIRNASTIMAHFGFGDGKNESGGTSQTPYYTLGIRASGSGVGNWSLSSGINNKATNWCSVALGQKAEASGRGSFAAGNGIKDDSGWNEDGPLASGDAAVAMGGGRCTAEGLGSLACGMTYKSGSTIQHTTAEAEGSIALGIGARARGPAHVALGYCTRTSSSYWDLYYGELACGRFNVAGYLFSVGCGDASTRRNAFSVDRNRIDCFSSSSTGTVYVNGSSVHSSDKRLKDHVAYLDDDAADFIRALKPIRYKWKSGGGEHYGFYAQDVRDADPHDTETVTEDKRNEQLNFDPLTLDYNALIAPLVAYTQQLERRIDEQQEMIERLTKRLDALEGR